MSTPDTADAQTGLDLLRALLAGYASVAGETPVVVEAEALLTLSEPHPGVLPGIDLVSWLMEAAHEADAVSEGELVRATGIDRVLLRGVMIHGAAVAERLRVERVKRADTAKAGA